jgi:hypothetical protein
MLLKTGTLLLVVGLGIGSVAVRAEEPETGTFDKAFSLPANGGDVVPVKAKVGSLVIDEIRLNNLPNKEEIQVAIANNSDDKCRPKIAVLISNPTAFKMKARLVASFEGADGTVYMKCERKDGVKPFADADRTDMCVFLEAMKSMQTRDWPKVKKVHVTADVTRDR